MILVSALISITLFLDDNFLNSDRNKIPLASGAKEPHSTIRIVEHFKNCCNVYVIFLNEWMNKNTGSLITFTTVSMYKMYVILPLHIQAWF